MSIFAPFAFAVSLSPHSHSHTHPRTQLSARSPDRPVTVRRAEEFASILRKLEMRIPHESEGPNGRMAAKRVELKYQ